MLHAGPARRPRPPGRFPRARRSKRSTRGGPFPAGGGDFDARRRVLSRDAAGRFRRRRQRPRPTPGSDAGARLLRSVVWDGVDVGAGARLTDCLAAGGAVPAGAHYDESPSLGRRRRRRRRRVPSARARCGRSWRPPSLSPAVVEGAHFRRSAEDAHDGHPVVPVPQVHRARACTRPSPRRSKCPSC